MHFNALRKDFNMSKKTNLSDLALYTTIAAVIGLGALITVHYMGRKKAVREIARLNAEIHNNEHDIHTYMVNAPEFAENRQIKKTLDSLKNRNVVMFSDAQEKYFNRIEKKYPLGRFMNNAQINRLNGIVLPYVRTTKTNDTNGYTLVKKLTPFSAWTTLAQFESVLHLLNIPPQKFAPLDMVVNDSFLVMFNDARQQKLFESYLEELSFTFSDFNENEPNFEIRENAEIRDEYTHNQGEIRTLESKIEQNNFLIGQTIAKFNRENDSLNALRAKYQSKLR